MVLVTLWTIRYVGYVLYDLCTCIVHDLFSFLFPSFILLCSFCVFFLICMWCDAHLCVQSFFPFTKYIEIEVICQKINLVMLCETQHDRCYFKNIQHIIKRRFLLELRSSLFQIASVPVWELSTPRIWRPWVPAPVSLRCRMSGLSVYSWPVSPECCCHLSGPPESQPAGKASVGSGEKSQAPTAARQSQRKQIIIL